MSRESLVFVIGLLLFLIVHLGLPETWKYYIFVVASLSLMVIGYGLRRDAYLRRLRQENGELQADSFTESNLETKE